ncbi:transposase [Clavibacter michiganensis]|nr:transposase [Clavibacter michiganensis]
MFNKQEAQSSRLRKTCIGVALAVSIALAPAATGGFGSGGQTTATSSSVSATVASGSASAAVPAAPSAPASPAAVITVDGAEKRGWVKPVIDWLKKNASSIIAPMKKAVGQGWATFQKWWNGISGWIRAGITTIVQGSLWEIFAGLRDYFF